MQKNGMYFGKASFYDLIRSVGGVWNDAKERPIVCLLPSTESDKLYWAVPVGNWNHRDNVAKSRIQKYLDYNVKDIRSCFYHIGNTDIKSIFFISDVVPITDTYLEREYIGKYTGKIYVIKNKVLLGELERKLKRVLAWENSRPNYFRQHITDMKKYLLKELKTINEAAITKE